MENTMIYGYQSQSRRSMSPLVGETGKKKWGVTMTREWLYKPDPSFTHKKTNGWSDIGSADECYELLPLKPLLLSHRIVRRVQKVKQLRRRSLRRAMLCTALARRTPTHGGNHGWFRVEWILFPSNRLFNLVYGQRSFRLQSTKEFTIGWCSVTYTHLRW